MENNPLGSKWEQSLNYFFRAVVALSDQGPGCFNWRGHLPRGQVIFRSTSWSGETLAVSRVLSYQTPQTGIGVFEYISQTSNIFMWAARCKLRGCGMERATNTTTECFGALRDILVSQSPHGVHGLFQPPMKRTSTLRQMILSSVVTVCYLVDVSRPFSTDG